MGNSRQGFIERTLSRFGFEKRSNIKSFDAWNAMFPTMFSGASSTPAITEVSAQRIATVFTCLNVRGETVGSLPFSVMAQSSTGPQVQYNNRIHRLIHDRPNDYVTAFDFWSTIEKLKLAWGNAYVEIIRDQSSQPIELYIREPWNVTIKQSNGEVYYEYKQRPILGTEILHFKNYSTVDGICGVSSIRQNAMTLGLAMKLNQYNSSIIGERPYGYLTSEKRPKDLQQKGNVRSLWDKRDADMDEDDPSKTNSKPKSIAGIPYLYGGLEFKSFTLPADDVAYIESAKLKDQDVYGIFRVPPTLAENYEKAPYNSSEQQDISFVKYSLAGIRAIEQECNEKLFPESNKSAENPLYCKFNLNGLLRGDMQTRSEYIRTMIQNGVMSPNKGAEFEELPTYEGGDQHFIQLNMVPVDKIADYVMAQINKQSATPPTREQIVSQLRNEFESKLKSKMNGHWAEIEGLLN